MQVSSRNCKNTSFGATVAKKVKREDIVTYYNNRIAAIKGKRDPLLQLDSFLKSKETKQSLSQLPKEDELFVDCRNMDIGDTHIIYNPANKESSRRILSVPAEDGVNIVLYKVEAKEGKLDVEGLSEWFNNLVSFFKSGNQGKIG